MFWKQVKITFQLARPFAVPFFAFSAIAGVVLAGGSFTNINAWLILVAVLFSVFGGHNLNSILDFQNGLDAGEKEDRSAEKSYTGGQNLIENGKATLNGITWNAVVWYLLSAIALIIVGYNTGSHVTWMILFFLWVIGALVPFLYSMGKFTSWGLHELSLGAAVGPLPLLMAMYAVNNHPPILAGILVSIIPAVVLSFAGLGLDEWGDAPQNLKKGVKSISFKIWEYSDWTSNPKELKEGIANTVEFTKSYSLLQWYMSTWLLMLFGFQIFLIGIGILKPMTGLGLIMFPPIMCSLVFLKKNFNRTAVVIIALAAVYLLLILIGQIAG